MPDITETEPEEFLEWQAGTPTKFSLGSDCPTFDPADALAEREEWARNVAELLDSPLFADIDRKHPVVAVLADDWFGHSMETIESDEKVTLVVSGFVDQRSGDPYHAVAIEFEHDSRDPVERAKFFGLDCCDIGYTDTARFCALNVLGTCKYFYWNTDDDLIGYNVKVIFPLGHQEGDATAT